MDLQTRRITINNCGAHLEQSDHCEQLYYYGLGDSKGSKSTPKGISLCTILLRGLTVQIGESPNSCRSGLCAMISAEPLVGVPGALGAEA